MIPTIPATNKITNNLKDLNFCLDKNYIEVNDPTAKFLRFTFKITKGSEEFEDENLYALKHGKFSFNPGMLFQSFAGLSETDILNFFRDFHVDVAPVLVAMKFEFLDGKYDILSTFNLPGTKFHKGFSTAIPADGSEVLRSLSYNTILPLAFKYSAKPVKFMFKNKVLEYDKASASAADHIFQILFFQKYHYADSSKLPVGFSKGFSKGFATAEAILNSKPLYRYEEGFTNKIESDYTIKGINFPTQINSLNIIWLDENDLFCGMTFTGSQIINREVINLINNYSVDFNERKAGALKTNKMKISTGWKMECEIDIVDSILSAKRIWIFGDDISKRVQAYCITEKLELDNTSNELVDFNLEFTINE